MTLTDDSLSKAGRVGYACLPSAGSMEIKLAKGKGPDNRKHSSIVVAGWRWICLFASRLERGEFVFRKEPTERFLSQAQLSMCERNYREWIPEGFCIRRLPDLDILENAGRRTTRDRASSGYCRGTCQIVEACPTAVSARDENS